VTLSGRPSRLEAKEFYLDAISVGARIRLHTLQHLPLDLDELYVFGSVEMNAENGYRPTTPL
jgi:hypothetical protein